MLELSKNIPKLCEASIKNSLSVADFRWPDKIEFDQWFFSPELISLSAIPEYEALSDLQKQKLSFFECVNFFSLNIHGEKSLLQGLSERLYRESTQGISSYLHHFIEEENNHMVYFGTFCTKYAEKIYVDRKFSFAREYDYGEEDFLFFAKILVFEEMVDVYNVKMSKDARLPDFVREINKRHHLDETRHLAFGRMIVRELFEKYSPQWSKEKRAEIQSYLMNYIEATSKEYVNPDVYVDAGLNQPYDLVEQVLHSSVWLDRKSKLTQNILKFFKGLGVFTEVQS